MSASNEKKPSVPSSHVTIKVSTQEDKCVFFRIKRDVELRRMMEAFSDKVGIEMSTIRFLFDGLRIRPNQTANELELQDQDEIDAFVDQHGGCSSFCHRS